MVVFVHIYWRIINQEVTTPATSTFIFSRKISASGPGPSMLLGNIENFC